MSKVTILQELEEISESANESIAMAKKDELESVRITYLGNHGRLNAIVKKLSVLFEDDRKEVGRAFNVVKKNIADALADRRRVLEKEYRKQPPVIDITEPGLKPGYGQIHPISKIIYEVSDIFRYLGFSVARGPEVEWDEINFQKLRLDKNHPSRDTQETYYFDAEMLLRVHTSSVQIRYLTAHKPPIRIISPGRVYRRDQIDATHLPSFYQIEGLLVDDCSRLTDLLGVLTFFAKRLFGEERRVRFYGHNFPYTEPSLEVEVQLKSGKWLEVLGCGMVHPEVLENCGVNPKKYRGWAFGMGADRLAMLKYGIGDIRQLYGGDLRFLNPE